VTKHRTTEPVPTSPRPRRIVLYARVSGDEQQRRETIAPQRLLLERLAEARSHPDLDPEQRLEVVEVILDEAVSGTLPLDERPGGRRILELIADRAVDQVWVAKLDRLGRSLRVILDAHDTLEAAGVALVTIAEGCDTSTPAGRFAFHMMGAVAEFERDTIVARMRDGRRHKAAQGKHTGGKPPFGYALVEGRLVPDETPIPSVGQSPADIVRGMYKAVALDGQSTGQVARDLTARGVPLSMHGPREIRPCTRTKPHRCQAHVPGVRPDGAWSAERVRYTIHETRHKGEGHLGEAVTFEAAPLVPAALWERAVAAVKANGQRSVRNVAQGRVYTLSGVLKCGAVRDGQVCGRALTGIQQRTGWRAYRGHMGGIYESPAGCDCRSSVPADEVERAVWRQVAAVLRDPRGAFEAAQARLAERRRDGPERAARLAALEQRLAELQAERDRTLLLFRKGATSEAETDAALDAVSAHIAEVEREQSVLLAEQDATDALAARLAHAGPTWAGYRARLDEIERTDDRAAMREIIGRLVSQVTITYATTADGRRQRQARVRLDLGEAFADEGGVGVVREPALTRRWSNRAGPQHFEAHRFLDTDVALPPLSPQAERAARRAA